MLKNKPFRLRPLLQQLNATYSASAKEKMIAFNILIPDTVPDELTGDADRLNQILVNLVSNAIKFTNEGDISISLEAVQTSNESCKIKFTVRDTGIGIPYDKQKLIFERFEQLDNTFIRQQGGTGLGLSIVKTIVEAMGSQITLESEPGKGSVFRFIISFQRKKQSEMSEPSRIQQVSITVSDASKNRVLLAEDNRVNQILVRKLLEPYALKIKFVTTGQEVLTALRQEEYDVLLMDVQMPVMDGITATEEIRNKTGNRIPIIGMTAYVQPNEVERCYAAGMNDYIAKPIDEGLFLKLLKKYIYLDTSVHAGYPAEESVSITRFPFLDKLCNFNINAIRKVLAEIEKQLQVDICSLENALMQQERSVMKRIVHHLKSTLSPLGPDSEAASILAEFADLLSEADDIKMKSAGMELIATLNTTRLSVQNELVEEM